MKGAGRFSPSSSGWGFVVRGKADVTSFGPVVTESGSMYALGATKGSNNAAELSAVIELFLYILEYAPVQSSVIISCDSKYAANIARGKWSPSSNAKLAALARNLWERVRTHLDVEWQWVKGHSGNTGNEAADKAADMGRTGTARVGRYALGYSGRNLYARGPPNRPVEYLPGQSLDNEAKQLSKALVESARSHIPVKPVRPRSTWISQGTLDVMASQKEAIRRGDHGSLAELRKRVRRSTKRDKRQYARDQFCIAAEGGEKEAFAAVRRGRKGFSSATTRIRYAGKTWPAQEVPEALANHLEEVPWASPPRPRLLP